MSSTDASSAEAAASRLHFKGALRSYADACALEVIDPRIQALVAALNVPGVVYTHSSCQGHRLPPFAARQTPFVMFRCALELAAKLSARVRAGQMTRDLNLRHYWVVEAWFLDDDQLVFCLQTSDRRFKRRQLDADFACLTLWAQEVFRA
ncbi:hypothetical protein [Achromobacter spanius]|uniref:hypothetical protein n=1 Tax=Achromobacter spanius TaxID=217203 RepID=UPI0037FB0B6D